MRLASAIGVFTLALSGAACRTSASDAQPDKTLAARLRELGVEGKTYANDLGHVRSIHLGKVYVAGEDLLLEDIHGNLTYLEASTLNPRWDYTSMPRPFDKSPDFTPSAVVGLSGGKLFVINRSNGTTDIEPRRVDVIPSGAPVATDTTIYVPSFPTPSGNKTVYAISLASGFVGWGWRTDDDVIGALAKGGPGAGDQFYFVTSSGVLHAFPTYPATERSPEVGWIRELHGIVTNDLALDGDDLAVVTNDGRLALVDRITGTVRWEAYPENSREQATGSAMFSSKYAFYRCGGELRAFTRDGGNKVWEVKDATGFIAERGNRMLLSGANDMVISVDKATGKELGRAHAPGWTFPPRVQPDSTLYAVSKSGVVLSIEFGF